MYSYYDASESHSSRRYESYERPRDSGSYLKPTAGTSEPRRRSGERPSESQTKDYSRQRSPYRYKNDARSEYADYPPPVPPDTGRPPRPQRSPNRGRSSWPPQPTCEDEATSLAKEAGSQELLRNVGKDEAQSRGKIDQEVLIEDVPEYINQDERRFVLSTQSKQNADPPTPPTSEDEKTRKARRRPSKLDMSFNKVNEQVPEMSKRPASPYSYSKPSTQSNERPSNTRKLSPEALLSPPPIDSRSRYNVQTGSRSQPSSPRRERDRQSPSATTDRDYFSLTGSENGIQGDGGYAKKPTKYSLSRDEYGADPRTSVADFATQPASTPVRRSNLDARRNTDTESTLPSVAKLRVDKTRRPTPLMASSALSELEGPRLSESPSTLQPPVELPLPRSRESSYVSSRGVSPAGSAVSAVSAASATVAAMAQRSPRNSGEFFLNRSAENSPTTSRNGSAANSRPTSPSPRTPSDSPRLPRTDLDWSALMALNAARRPKPSSRLSAPVRQESAPIISRLDTKQRSPRTDSLPYPMDDGPSTPTIWMPSERKHQYFPETRAGGQLPPVQEPETLQRSTVPSLGFIPPAGTRPTRPSFQSRHSTSEMPQAEKRLSSEMPKATESRRAPTIVPSQARKDMQNIAKKGALPACVRSKPIAGYSDWYTLVGAPNLDFCPDCIDAIFERTVLRNSFRKSPPLNLNTKVVCALGGLPWIQLAWLLTLQQERADLNLLKDIAEVEGGHAEQCPGDASAVQTWYGIRDSDGMFVKNFYICYSDVRKIARLLPTINDLFVRLPYRMNEDEHVCAMRTEGNRFGFYIDTLIRAHEKAIDSRRKPDTTNFIECVKRRQRLRECTKDGLFTNGLWHYIPNLPEFTVCEDCYEATIEPHVQKNSDLAMRFHRTMQPAYSEGGLGSSCQLYSTRMRKIFEYAVRDKDFKYLARKAKERRENELKLQEEYRRVMARANRLSSQSGRSGMSEDDERALDREVAEITAEWKSMWE